MVRGVDQFVLEDPVTEIPPHLLERSRARRAALGLGGGEGAAPVPAATSAAAPAAKAEAKAPAATGAAAAPAAPAAPARVLPEYVVAANERKKIPFWAVPVLLMLPIWGFLYVGTLEAPPKKAAGVLAEGAAAYQSRCAGCHGATGGGGSGPAMAGGEVLKTWPKYEDHVWWVVNGSASVKGQPYGATGKTASGGMPGFGETLSAKELLSIVYYERVAFGGEKEADLAVLKEMAENAKLPGKLGGQIAAPKDVDALVDQLGLKATKEGAAG